MKNRRKSGIESTVSDNQERVRPFMPGLPYADGCYMKLSSDLLAEITESVTIVGRDEPREADRRSPRIRLSNQLIAYNWYDRSKPIGMRVRDLSEGGIGILHNERIGLDEKFVIDFPRKGGKQLLILGTVVYWEPLAEKLYAIGLQFDRFVERAEFDNPVAGHRDQGNVMSRLTQVFARTWRAAS